MANNNEQDVMMNSFPEATDGKYFYLESEDGKQIRVTNASAARMISSAIKNDPNLLANVNFGAKTSSELASVVAGEMPYDAMPTGGVYASTQLWEGGPHWAKWNVGANSETEYGDLFAWGATKPYRLDGTTVIGSTDNYSASKAASITKDLKPNEDAATVNMGSGWRMPTKAELAALIDNTDSTWTTIGGVNGRKFADKRDADNYIFFPASGYVNGSSLRARGSNGYYWSRSFNSSTGAWKLAFNSSGQGTITDNRYYGFSVRGVRS